MFDQSDFHIVDSGAWIRENIGRFFPDGLDPVTLAVALAEEGLRLAGGRVQIEESNGWLFLEVENDWLLGWDSPFSRLTPLPQLGQNKVSLLATAAALGSDVATWTEEGWRTVFGNRSPEMIPLAGFQRIIAFATTA